MPTDTKPEKTPRPVQPKCDACHHPRSFHGGGTTPCRALGCQCERWVEPAKDALPA